MMLVEGAVDEHDAIEWATRDNAKRDSTEAEHRHYVEFLVPLCAEMLVCPTVGTCEIPRWCRRHVYGHLNGRVMEILEVWKGGGLTVAGKDALLEVISTPWWRRIFWP